MKHYINSRVFPLSFLSLSKLFIVNFLHFVDKGFGVFLPWLFKLNTSDLKAMFFF